MKILYRYLSRNSKRGIVVLRNVIRFHFSCIKNCFGPTNLLDTTIFAGGCNQCGREQDFTWNGNELGGGDKILASIMHNIFVNIDANTLQPQKTYILNLQLSEVFFYSIN